MTMQHSNKNLFLEDKVFNHDCNIMLFDLSIYGHHPSYILHLINYWRDKNISTSLNIVVSPKFIQEHSDVVKIASDSYQKNINFIPITQEEEVRLKSRSSGINRTVRAFQEWNLFCKYASFLKATQCLIMYFDTCQLPLVLGMKPPCPFSGIYFRPTFHYSNFSNYIPSWKNRVQQWRETFLITRVLHHPQLKTLFCLDPFAVKHIENFHSQAKVIHLPDPVLLHNKTELQTDLRESLGLHSHRQVFLLLGALTERKGIYQLLDAIKYLPTETCEQICILLVGEANDENKVLIQSKISAIRKSQPIQIISHYNFIPVQELEKYFQIANIVLAPYQRHVGMSGILILAAAAQKPVLSSNYGLMGEIVQRYKLGITVDSSVPEEIAKGLSRFLLEPHEQLCDKSQMQLFAKQNSAERFANVICQYI